MGLDRRSAARARLRGPERLARRAALALAAADPRVARGLNLDREPSPYERLGGETRLRAVVERFYALMDDAPEYYGIRKLHPASLAGSTDKLFMFLSGWLGGPSLYVERYGHPRLRARHLPFPIGAPERDQWLACMREAMATEGVEPALRDALLEAFAGTADWMRNRADD